MEDSQLYVSGEELGLSAPLTVGDEGTITLHFRVTSVSADTDMETGAETGDVRYTLEAEILSSEVDETGLRDSVKRSLGEQSGDRPLRVKTQFSPSPG